MGTLGRERGDLTGVLLRCARNACGEVRRAVGPRSACSKASEKSRTVGKRSASVFSKARWIAASTSSGIECRTTRKLGTSSSESRARIAIALGPSKGG